MTVRVPSMIHLALATAFCSLGAGAAHASEPRALPQAIHFEPNVGQTDPQAKFLAHGSRHGLFVTDSGLVLKLVDLPRPEHRQPGPMKKSQPVISAVEMKLAGGRKPSSIVGLDKLPGVSAYRIGDRSRWHDDVPHFARVKMESIYPGIDLVLHGASNQVEYDFVVAAGADADAIRLDLSGAQSMALDHDGNLVLETAAGRFQQHKPVAYQEIDGARRPVSAAFRRQPNGQIAFALGRYDRRHPLVIDPILNFTRRVEGDNSEIINDMTVDSAGNVWATGQTFSTSFFQTHDAYQQDLRGDGDAYVIKLDAQLQLDFATYYGGSGTDAAQAIAVDTAGHAFIVGSTDSSDLPLVKGTEGWNGTYESFVASISRYTLDYAQYLGAYSSNSSPAGDDLSVNDVAVKSSTEIWLTGSTNGDTFRFTKNGFSKTRKGGYDAFIMRIDPSVGTVNYFTYYGGSNDDFGAALASIPGTAGVKVVGSTRSSDLGPGAVYGPGSRANGIEDVFTIKCTGASFFEGGATVGGSGADYPEDILFDSAGNTYVVGETLSTDYPLVGATQGSNHGSSDLFITKLNPNVTSILYSTYLGGSGNDYLGGAAVTSGGTVYVTGATDSTNFPTKAGAVQSSWNGGAYDAFLAKLNPIGKQVYGSYIGGTGYEWGAAVAFRKGALYVAVNSDSEYLFDAPNVNTLEHGVIVRLTSSALFVTPTTTLSAADTKIKSRLVSLGFQVEVAAASTVTSSNADGKDVVVVSSTVSSSAVNSKFKSTKVPVVVFESAVQDDMAMTGTATTEYGTTATQSQVVMLTSSDPLSAGLSSTQTVTSAGKTFNWGKPGSNAVKVARQVSDTTKIMVYRYEAGKTMIGTFAAPERRVGFFLGDDAASYLNTTGWKLFDAAVKWAAGF
jgi:hypothetical protein